MTEEWRAFDSRQFQGRVSLVTGAASGMGRETVRAFAAHGARVIAADRDGEGVEALAAELRASGGDVRGIMVDVAREASIADMYRAVDGGYGVIDNVVTCAAVITSAPSLDASWEHWRRVLDIDLLGTFFVLREGVRRMLPRGSGNLVAVASDAGKRGGGGAIADAAYAAAKAGVLATVKSLAREFRGRGLRVNSLVPGVTDTPMHTGVSAELRERIAAGIPIGRLATPGEMAAAILFLCSDAASYMYAASLNVDGGSLFE